MKVYTVADNIISPLGFSSGDHFAALKNGQSAIRKISSQNLLPEPFYGAAIDRERIAAQFTVDELQQYTFIEQLFILSIRNIFQSVPGINKNRLLLIVSTTKGNIDLLGEQEHKNAKSLRLELAAMAKFLNAYFKIPNEPLVVSNACISGVSAMITGGKLIRMGLYEHVLIVGGDILSEFTLSGFQSLKAISDEACRPYDAARKGINLGEACGSVLLSKDQGLCNEKKSLSILRGGGQSNDANHISGPSRSGKGLKIAISSAVRNAGIGLNDIGYINAHGTATLFNDEMEAIAFHDLGLQQVPLNSLKGYFGHTLGAAGVVETIMTTWQLNNNILLKSPGFEEAGVSRSIQVLKENTAVPELEFGLKTVSGFGGCNAALIVEKV